MIAATVLFIYFLCLAFKGSIYSGRRGQVHWFIQLGANELKTSKQGMSKPIQIKLRTPQGNYDNSDLKDLLFYDLSYITQQIFSFTYLSWRSFLPGEEPATMKYSNLISRLLGKMRNVPGWDADKLNYGLKRKKWFL